jgi:protein-disulfide isomerase
VKRLLVFIGLAACGLVLGIAAPAITQGWREARVERAVAANAEAVFRSPASPVTGNPEGDVSVVTFYDPNCPYCREAAPVLKKLIDDDGKVRLVLEELPMLGPDSRAAARLMLAADHQGKYFDMFEQMLTTPGRATTDKALKVAGDLGLDTARLEKDAADPAIEETLAATTQLAKTIGVNGVPFLIVGDRVIGVTGKDLYGELTNKVAEVRKDGCRNAC